MVDVVGQLQRLQALVMKATAATTVESVARVLVEEGSSLLGARTGGLWLLAGDELQLADFRSPGEVSRYTRLPISHDAPLPACVRAREPIWIEDADDYARRFPASSSRTGVRVGCACLPLLTGGDVIGAAVFAFEEPRAFSEPEKVSLALLARQCAQAIERLRLIEAERTARLAAEQAADRMTRLQAAVARLSAARGQDEIARIVIDESIALLGATAAALWLRSGSEVNMVAQLGGTRTSVTATARLTLDDRGPLGGAMRTRTSVWLASRAAAAAGGYPINDARWDGIEALAFVPLVASDELVGALGMSFSQRRAFEARDREFVELFASHASQALVRAREDETERILAESSKAIAASLDPQVVLERLAELSVARLADFCSVDIEREGVLVRAVVTHAHPEHAALAARLRVLEPAPRNVLAAIMSQRPLLIAPITDWLIERSAYDAAHGQLLRDLAVRSAVTAPMMIGGRAVGAITWGSCTRLFDERDVELAERIAGGAAAALENARLYSAEAASARGLAKHQELVAALSSARTPLDVCQAAAQKGVEAIGALAAMIWLRSSDGKLKLTGAAAPPEWCAQWAVISADPAMPVNRVIASGEPLIVETPLEYEQKAAETFPHAVLAKRVNAFVTVPLTIGGVRCGAFTISFEGAHRFTREERESILAIARSCEQALERAQLYVTEATARREAEAVSRAKDTFVAMAGHALRNRISPMLTALEVMRLSGRREDVLEREIIERQAQELVALIDELLAVASGTALDTGIPRPRKFPKGSGLEPSRTSTRSLRVLVVEDNADMAFLLGNLLRTLGHDPLIAHDGPSALACAERDRPHLVLLDLGLPGMDGFELVRRLREQPSFGDVPVVAVTGYDQASDRARTREAGFVEHLVKPVDLEQLYAIVGRYS